MRQKSLVALAVGWLLMVVEGRLGWLGRLGESYLVGKKGGKRVHYQS